MTGARSPRPCPVTGLVHPWDDACSLECAGAQFRVALEDVLIVAVAATPAWFRRAVMFHHWQAPLWRRGQAVREFMHHEP